MNWNDRELDTIGKLMDTAIAIMQSGDSAAGQRFLEAYRAENQHADENIGYMAGYYSRETADALLTFFHVSHPVFGDAMPKQPESAFLAGLAAGREDAS